MKNTQIWEQNKARIWLRCGTRGALLFESDLPAGSTQMVSHLRELAGALLAYAKQVYLPVARGELEELARVGRGYDFIPHRLQFCATARTVQGRVRLELSLQYQGGTGARLAQRARQIWSADGAYRLR